MSHKVNPCVGCVHANAVRVRVPGWAWGNEACAMGHRRTPDVIYPWRRWYGPAPAEIGTRADHARTCEHRSEGQRREARDRCVVVRIDAEDRVEAFLTASEAWHQGIYYNYWLLELRNHMPPIGAKVEFNAPRRQDATEAVVRYRVPVHDYGTDKLGRTERATLTFRKELPWTR